MKWECRKRRLGWLGSLTTPEAEYHGHTLEYVRGIAWSGWRCQWCGASFKTSEEHQHAGFPPMEVIETEDESDVFEFVIKTCMTERGGRLNALSRSMIVDAKIAHLDRSCREITFSRLSKGMV